MFVTFIRVISNSLTREGTQSSKSNVRTTNFSIMYS